MNITRNGPWRILMPPWRLQQVSWHWLHLMPLEFPAMIPTIYLHQQDLMLRVSLTRNMNLRQRWQRLNWRWISELWRLLHRMSPKTDLSKAINSTLYNPDIQESVYELFENENLTYWSKDSDFNLNDSRILLPRNRTSLAAGMCANILMRGMWTYWK